MQEDFHYYATYCAAHLAGHDAATCADIAYCAQLPDLFTRTFLASLGGPSAAATTQPQLELADARTVQEGYGTGLASCRRGSGFPVRGRTEIAFRR